MRVAHPPALILCHHEPAIAQQVPELKKLLDLRAALTALKGPLGNEKAFRNKIQNILNDPGQRNKIINELGLKKEGE